MNKDILVAALKQFSDKEFIELFYRAANDRHLYPLESEYLESHLVLANAVREKRDDGEWSAWKAQWLCPTPDQDWVDDATVGQFGEHCGHETASWAKRSQCPVCRGVVYGT